MIKKECTSFSGVKPMLKYKHMRLDQNKIQRAKKVLNAKTETDALDKALDRVILEDQERLRRKKIVKRIADLRRNLGKMEDDPTLWIHMAREERILSHDGGSCMQGWP
jgi:hypothetical protein